MSLKIFGKCVRCNEFKRLTRGYCATKCYRYAMKNHIIEKIPKEQSPEKLNSIQEQILIGSMLGDGCIFQHKTSTYPYLSVVRKTQDLDYLQYEFQYFKDFCNNKEIKKTEIFDYRTNKTYYQCKFVTRASKAFETYYLQWYANGVKALPRNLPVLTPLTCGIWFCDDGCVTIHKTTKRLRLKLSTHCFTEADNVRLAKHLYDKFNSYFGIGHDDGKSYIVTSDGGAKSFIDYIKNHIYLPRKITWSEDCFAQSVSLPHRKNRNQLSDKEIVILKILYKEPLNPKKIANKMGWVNSDPLRTPSGLSLYLNNFIKHDLVEKYGTANSYKDPIKYKLTKNGLKVLHDTLGGR